jgi:4-diphosphocytidyl-2C-methyl-D-erythritol kinase
LINDLRSAAVSLCPPVAEALSALEDPRGAAADLAMVCGSGPTVAGLFWGSDAPDRALAAATALRERYPNAVAAAPVGAEFGSPRVV